MSHTLPVQAAVFDMDGLLIDSEPFWLQSENQVFSSIGLDMSLRDRLPDLLGLRIDQVVELWYQVSPWQTPSKEEVIQRIIDSTIAMVKKERPLLPGVEHALSLCQSLGLKIALASASPLYMLESVLEMFNIRHYFDAVVSAGDLPYSKPHPQVYLNAAEALGVPPVQCVALEDSVNGMIACKAARMRSIVVPSAEMAADPRWSLADYRLSSLRELTAAMVR
ncbi:hexitol phosphatase HxpB [Morganella morganii]|uniref:hexitol phosphatase HxpB n=1 Tax=Morganella morganii TaxID=582 RepID=UPI001BD9601A|nr:hexitol phosphatase HxpB [Morganella morganii]MBT0421565.1 hexitol phosphatase HxpB [Morganella morganii subsp. morganii]MBT0515985.1 hexitol phosphatase HxpB [Morganella morganii subsp. morganii]QWM05754.1 hexitol phosphatase HxpB [Morganella morganii subsp. morganii]